MAAGKPGSKGTKGTKGTKKKKSSSSTSDSDRFDWRNENPDPSRMWAIGMRTFTPGKPAKSTIRHFAANTAALLPPKTHADQVRERQRAAHLEPGLPDMPDHEEAPWQADPVRVDFFDALSRARPSTAIKASSRRRLRRQLRQNWLKLMEDTLDIFTEMCSPERLQGGRRTCTEERCGLVNDVEVLVSDVSSHRIVQVHTCGQHLPESLLRMRLFPSSPRNPRHAFPFDSLTHFRHLFLTAGVPAEALYHTMILTHEELQLDLRKVFGSLCTGPTFKEALNWFCRFVRSRDERLADAARTDMLDEESKALARLAGRCPLCFGALQRGQGPPVHIPGPDLFVSIDGNFQLKRRGRKDAEVRTTLPASLFLSEERVQAMRQEMEGQPMPEGFQGQLCDAQLLAADNKAKTAAGFFDITGVVAMVCRHDVPLLACDIDTPGERYEYALALIDELMEALGDSVSQVAIIYDIACRISVSVEARKLLPKWRDKLVWAVPIFHAFSHNVQCQLRFSTRHAAAFGLTDGEGTERVWSALSSLVATTRHMGHFRRREALEDRMSYISAQKRPKAFDGLATRLSRTVVRARLAYEEIDVHRSLWNTPEWLSAAAETKAQWSTEASESQKAWLEWIVASASGEEANTAAVVAHMFHRLTTDTAAVLASLPPFANDAATRADRRAMLGELLPMAQMRRSEHLRRRTMTVNRCKAYVRLQMIYKEQAFHDRALSQAVRQEDILEHGRYADKLKKEVAKLYKAHPTLDPRRPDQDPVQIQRAVALGELDRVHGVLVDREHDLQKLRRSGPGLGTKELSRLKEKHHKHNKAVSRAVKGYNDLIDSLDLSDEHKTALQLSPTETSLALVQARMANWDTEDSSRRLHLWEKDTQLNECLDGLEDLCRAVEELAIIDREAHNALKWLGACVTRFHGAAEREQKPDVQWLLRRERKRLATCHATWRETLGKQDLWSDTLPWMSRSTHRAEWSAVESLMALRHEEPDDTAALLASWSGLGPAQDSPANTAAVSASSSDEGAVEAEADTAAVLADDAAWASEDGYEGESEEDLVSGFASTHPEDGSSEGE